MPAPLVRSAVFNKELQYFLHSNKENTAIKEDLLRIFRFYTMKNSMIEYAYRNKY